MRECWVDRLGEIHEGGNHLEIAQKIFPKSKNPELSCEKAGYVKLGIDFSGSPYMLNRDKRTETQAQLNAITFLWEEHYGKKLNK